MLQDLLKQRGIPARLDGAGLHSAVGELPAIGLVRLLVAEEDYPAAREVIEEWEKSAVPDVPPIEPRRPMGAVTGLALGAILGIVGAFLYFRVPVNAHGIDHNDDGVIDERWNSSAAGTPTATEVDRNFDGAVDLVWNHDLDGVAVSGESDDDFNGTFETRFKLRHGQVYLSEVDTDGDTLPDLKSRARFGVLATVAYRGSSFEEPVRVETYRLGRLVSAEVDTDRDGALDRRDTYDDFGEISASEPFAPSLNDE
jgi:hypothetical protein